MFRPCDLSRFYQRKNTRCSSIGAVKSHTCKQVLRSEIPDESGPPGWGLSMGLTFLPVKPNYLENPAIGRSRPENGPKYCRKPRSTQKKKKLLCSSSRNLIQFHVTSSFLRQSLLQWYSIAKQTLHYRGQQNNQFLMTRDGAIQITSRPELGFDDPDKCVKVRWKRTATRMIKFHLPANGTNFTGMKLRIQTRATRND